MSRTATAPLTILRSRGRVGQRLFQFLIDLEDVDLQETVQQLFDRKAECQRLVVADVHCLAFTRAATSLAEAIGGALGDVE